MSPWFCCRLSPAVSCQEQQLTWHCEAARGHEATLVLLRNGRCLSTRGRSLLVNGVAAFWSHRHLPLFWTQWWESYSGGSFAWNAFSECVSAHVSLHISNYYHEYEFAAPSWKLVLVANSLWKRLSRGQGKQFVPSSSQSSLPVLTFLSKQKTSQEMSNLQCRLSLLQTSHQNQQSNVK